MNRFHLAAQATPSQDVELWLNPSTEIAELFLPEDSLNKEKEKKKQTNKQENKAVCMKLIWKAWRQVNKSQTVYKKDIISYKAFAYAMETMAERWVNVFTRDIEPELNSLLAQIP